MKDINKEIFASFTAVPIVKFLEKKIGFEKTLDIIYALGLPLDFLYHKESKISVSYLRSLLNEALKTNDNTDEIINIYKNDEMQIIYKNFIETDYFSDLSIKKIPSDLLLKYFLKRIFGNVINFSIEQNKKHFTVKISFLNEKEIKPLNYILTGMIYSIFNLLDLKKFKIIALSDPQIDTASYKINYSVSIINFNLIFNALFTSLTLFFPLLFLKNIISLNLLIIMLLIIIHFFSIKRQINLFISSKKIKKETSLKDDLFLELFDKIQSKYKIQIEIDSKLKEKNKYLSVINKIRKSINSALYFDPILFEVALTLTGDYNFIKGIYFNYNFTDDYFKAAFEFSNNEEFNELLLNTTINDFKINLMDYLNTLFKLNYPLSIHEFNTIFNIIPKEHEYKFKKKSISIYFLNLSISEEYLGFYMFFTDKINIIDQSVYELFENIQDQLSIAYEKISSRNIIENILSNIPAFVVILHKETFNVKYANNRFTSSYPKTKNIMTKEDIIDSNFFSLIDNEENKNMINEYINIFLSDNKKNTFEIVEENNIYAYNIFNISSQNKKEKFLGFVINDITEARYFQKHLLDNEKLLALGRVASGIAHEINNPLYAVLSNAEEISEEKNIKPEIKIYADEIIEHVENVSNIIKDLSIYSKSLRKKEDDNIDINNVIDEALKLVKYSSNFLEVEIIKNFSDLPAIKALKGEIEQIFINIFNNAIQAMNGKGTLEINTRHEDDKILISIKDSGSGIPEKDQDHIFELFYTTKSLDKGSGIGLHIVKKIIDKYNGEITFESKEKTGTTFYIKFQI